MQLQLKNEYIRLRVFLWVSMLVGFTLCLLQSMGFFFNFDALLFSLDSTLEYSFLPLPVMILIIMFHTFLPGLAIVEEGTIRGFIYTCIIWFFYIVLIHSYASESTVYIPMVAPLLGCILSMIRILAWEESILIQEKNGMRKTLNTCVEPRIADMLLNNPDICNQDGVRTHATIMFADLRGFTQLCENSAPEVVISMLRDCFGRLISIARAHDGTIDKLIGDSMMVVWGNPVPMENHAEKAVTAAIEMQAAMQELKEKWKHQLGVEIMLGIGINTDEVIAGTIGSIEYCDYTVLGSGVNLASRLESVCPGDKICVSETTYTLIQNSFRCSEPTTLQAKHNGGAISAYQVLV
jgi:adenylate cyclase